MFNSNKTAVAAAVLALCSSAAFAGTMGGCTAVNVTVPCDTTAWNVEAAALYIQPVVDADQGYYGYSRTFTTSGATVTGEDLRYNKFQPQWGWGFKLAGSYHFNTGNDLNLNWYHYNHTTDHNVNIGIVDVLEPTQNSTLVAYNSTEVKWDAVNLEFGQHVDFGEFTNIRFHAGVQFVQLERQGSSNFTYLDTTAGTVFSGIGYGHSNRKFNGFGPRIGSDLSYDWGNGFAIYGNAAATILIGKTKFNDSFVSNTVLTLPSTYVSGSKTGMVPELESKLGATYTYDMAQGNLTVDLGYMWVNYFNALHGVSPVTGAGIGETDLGFDGPYIGLKWVGVV